MSAALRHVVEATVVAIPAAELVSVTLRTACADPGGPAYAEATT